MSGETEAKRGGLWTLTRTRPMTLPRRQTSLVCTNQLLAEKRADCSSRKALRSAGSLTASAVVRKRQIKGR